MSEESRPPVAEAADLPQVLAYLREREENLAKYSDKLRKAVERISNVFGHPSKCQVCGNDKDNHIPKWKVLVKYPEQREKWVYAYCADTAEEAMQKARSEFGDAALKVEIYEAHEKDRIKDHKFVPKIHVSIDLRDDEPFYEDDERTATLAIREGELEAVVHDKEHSEEIGPYYVHDISRTKLKALVRSGRLVKFIQKVKDEVEREEREVRELAEIAEKLAKAVEDY